MGSLTHLIESFRPGYGAALAFVVALAAGLACRWLRWPSPAGLAAGAGVLAGWLLRFGMPTASPRQLPERLPLLVLALVVAAPILLRVARRWRWLALPFALVCAVGVGWWMAGAPLVLPDLRRSALVLAGVAAGSLLVAWRSGPAWAPPVTALVLLLGLAASNLPGPYILLGGVLLAATLGAAVSVPGGTAGGASVALASMPAAGAVAALGSVPILARGGMSDWAVAAAPLAALLIGAPLGATLSRRIGAPLGAIVAGALCAVLAYVMR